ncbi:hypothetical protein DLJ49_15850 [Rhodovulum sp. 12E13]|uniref:hypothetical protein n=1 Tax=Rhodovulum sp. 12E13 TaxID=2203891 RepID=UPI000E153644|nr:hypothetical protein [Rhodovulum sp. 12E13]RDC71143.1 hypothetical protein DLJ49_15850 [Rhodovulum sp. 12E13]
MKPLALAAATAAFLAGAAQANDYAPAMQAFLDAQVRSWAQDPVLVSAIAAQNARTGGLAQSEIDALDQAWQSEVGSGATPTIDPVMQNAAADFLRARVSESGGMITEVFAFDARGLNVAASDVTSDYWQGDEEKYSETYPVGADAVHFGEVEFDDSTQTFQGQISLTITDPATGEAIGAMTVGVNAEALM